jgi:hypothetical protein
VAAVKVHLGQDHAIDEKNHFYIKKQTKVSKEVKRTFISWTWAKSMFVDRKVRYSALFTNLVG